MRGESNCLGSRGVSYIYVSAGLICGNFSLHTLDISYVHSSSGLFIYGLQKVVPVK